MAVDCQRAIARLWAGLLALLVVVGAGCGGGNGDDPCEAEDPPCAECNQCPTTLGFMPDDTILVGETKRVNVADFFRDADSLDVLVYAAESSDTSTVEVEMAGSALTYFGADGGEADITVTAADDCDCSARPAKQEFEVTVLFPNRPPSCVFGLPPPPFIYTVGTTGEELPQCSDPDGDALTITAVSSDPNIFTATLVGDAVVIEALAVGTAVLTVTAIDPEGLSGEATAEVIVVEEEG